MTIENENVELSVKELSKRTAVFNFVFGALVIIGGVIGYISAKSISSLTSGMVFGNLLMLSVWGTDLFSKTPKKWGHIFAVIISAALTIFFILRLLKTGKPMPAIPIICLGIFGIITNLFVLHKKSLLQIEAA